MGVVVNLLSHTAPYPLCTAALDVSWSHLSFLSIFILQRYVESYHIPAWLAIGIPQRNIPCVGMQYYSDTTQHLFKVKASLPYFLVGLSATHR